MLEKPLAIRKPFILNGGNKVDATTVVGPGCVFETIEDLLAVQDVCRDGALVDDWNNSVTWQIYFNPGAVSVSTTGMYEARLYDGSFFVKACDAGVKSINISGSPLGIRGNATLDGVSCVADDVVLLTMQWPQLNGVWIVKSGLWVRHPIFDQSADKLSGVTFIVSEGNQYANSQWEFTTIGDVTPSTLASSYQELASDPTLLLSYTWLNFQMINGCYPQRDVIEIDSAIERFNFNNFVDATAGDIDVGGVMFLLPGKPYYVTKIDSSTNKVLFGGTGDAPYWVLLEQNDWLEFFLKENNNVSSDNFGFKSNRINKTLIPETRTTDGKLSLDVPLGYLLYSITTTMTGNSSNSLIYVGTTLGAFDLANLELVAGTPITTVINSSSVTEIYVAEDDVGHWYGGTLTVSYLIVKEG